MVRMVLEIIKDMRYFLLLVACMAVGFGSAFYLLFSTAAVTESSAPYFSDVSRTLVTMLAAMTGNFDQTVFWEAKVPWLAVLLLVVYVLLMVVVLFNLLIAIMGHTFQKVSLLDWAQVPSLCGSLNPAGWQRNCNRVQ